MRPFDGFQLFVATFCFVGGIAMIAVDSFGWGSMSLGMGCLNLWSLLNRAGR
jgi:hypothetical protein